MWKNDCCVATIIENEEEFKGTDIESAPFFIMGRDPVELAKRAKYKPPAMRVRGVCYTKKSPFRYNKVVQANL